MKRLAIFILFLLTSTAILAETFINTVGSDDGIAIAGFDTVSFFTQKKAVLGRPEFEHAHLGATWRFSSEENLKLFKEDPDKYIPQWGGQCAWCVSENCVSKKKLNGEFEFIEGKLYLFSYGVKSRNSAKDDFLYGRVSRSLRIRDGDNYWPALKKRLEEGAIVQPNSSNYTKTRFE